MSELQQLERELACGAARADIERHCQREHHSGQYYGPWYNEKPKDPDDSERVARAVRYLDLRGLLIRHPKESHLVRTALQLDACGEERR